MSQSKSDSQFVWTKLILLFGGIVASASFVYLTYWSFGETWKWFTFLDFNGNSFVSLTLALVFQYGQGPVLYLRAKFLQRHRELTAQVGRYGSPPSETDPRYMKYSELLHDANSAWWAGLGFAVVFAVFAVIDAWTNMQQMWLVLDAKQAAGQSVGSDKYIFTGTIGIVLVFVEELLGLAVSMSGNLLNDIRVIYGYKRLAWLDMFGRLAEEQLSGRWMEPKAVQPNYRPVHGEPVYQPSGTGSNRKSGTVKS